MSTMSLILRFLRIVKEYILESRSLNVGNTALDCIFNKTSYVFGSVEKLFSIIFFTEN